MVFSIELVFVKMEKTTPKSRVIAIFAINFQYIIYYTPQATRIHS